MVFRANCVKDFPTRGPPSAVGLGAEELKWRDLVDRFHETCVGRVLFNPPFHERWRVKENPPYTRGYDSNFGNTVLTAGFDLIENLLGPVLSCATF